MKHLAIITATRAEYGLLEPLIKELRKSESEYFHVDLIVTGTHLSDKFGHTIDEIISDGIRIDYQIDIPVDSDSPHDISNDQAMTLIKFTDFFSEHKYDAVVILGDRYEMLAVAIAAGNTHTPIFHLYGGDTTEGAIDEWIRHSITKMAYLHFTSNEVSRRRVIQLGENPDRVYNYGSLGIDNCIHRATMNREEALNSIGLTECKYALCTYHPVTMEKGLLDKEIKDFLDAIAATNNMQFIVTMSNSDMGGESINARLVDSDRLIDNLHVFSSLGVVRYLSLMKYAEFVMGNSSSGLYEAPIFHVPTINIGDRQKGRLRAASVIDCKPDKRSILSAISLATSTEFKNSCQHIESIYGDGHAAEKISAKIIETVSNGEINLEKKFFDIPYDLLNIDEKDCNINSYPS